MSCKQKREITLFLSVVTVYLYTFQVCHSVSLGQRGDGFSGYQGQESTATRWKKGKQDEDIRLGNWHSVDKVIQGTYLRKTAQPGLREIWPELAGLPDDLVVPKLDKTSSNFAANSSSWSVDKIGRQRRTSAPDTQDGYHADLTGYLIKGELHLVIFTGVGLQFTVVLGCYFHSCMVALTCKSRGKTTTKWSLCLCLQCCSISFRFPWSPGEGFGSIFWL